MYFADCKCQICLAETRWRLKVLGCLCPEVQRHLAPADVLLQQTCHEVVTRPGP